jgi:hypothetical protein
VTEQLSIVEFLSHETARIERLRDESRNAIGLLNEHRSALITAAVTGKRGARQSAIREVAA